MGKVVSLDLQPMVCSHSTCYISVLTTGAIARDHYTPNGHYAAIDDTPRARCFRWKESRLGSL
jgi:hypothetical protein